MPVLAAPLWGRFLGRCYHARAKPKHCNGALASLGGGDLAILIATETGEYYAVGEYKKAPDENLPAPLRKIVERQFLSVKRAHDRVRGMRDKLGQ